MKKSSNLLVVLLILLMTALIGFFVIYNSFYLPNEKLSNAYIEVYQEIEPYGNTVINLYNINHKVVIRKTEGQKIKLSYFQKIDNGNQYTVNQNSVTLNLIEKVEDLDNIFYQSKRHIDTVNLYLPENTYVSIIVNTSSGSLDVENAAVRKLTVLCVGGSVRVANSKISDLDLATNYGSLSVANTEFNQARLSNVTGTFSFQTEHSLYDYSLDIGSDYGTLTLNGEPVYEETEEGRKEVSRLQHEAESGDTLNISTVRSNIVLQSREPVPEPQPEPVTPEESSQQTPETNPEKENN